MAASANLPTHNAPLCFGESHVRVEDFLPQDARARMEQFVAEAHKFVLGPMPTRGFIEFIMRMEPASNLKGQIPLHSRDAFKSVPTTPSCAAEIHAPLLEALNKATKRKSRCPGFTFATLPPEVGLSSHTIACYANGTPPLLSPNDATVKTALGYAELLIHVNADPAQDPFLDPLPDGPRPFLATTLDPKILQRTLGHQMDLVAELMARQYREHVYTVSLFGSRARLLRWDRAGCLATESFDLRSHPEHLCKFLWRFSQASNAGRGHDPTVGPASPEEEELFRTAVTQRVAYELGLTGEALAAAVAEHYAHGQVVALEVDDPEEEEVRRFIVSRPVVSPVGVTGPCTRGFWAVEPARAKVVFAKDIWSPLSVDVEGAILRSILDAGVRNVPEMVCHAHFRRERRVRHTLSDGYQRAPWYTRPPGCGYGQRLFHYRIVLGTVGYALDRFRGTDELLHATYDAFQAMQDAYNKDSRIHRNLSVRNIILVRDPLRAVRRGYLVDWEVSFQVDDEGEPRNEHHVGTWEFIASELQMDPDTPQTLAHDTESLVWVVLYAALRWLPHSTPNAAASELVYSLFEAARVRPDGVRLGGRAKRDYARDRDTAFGSPLDEWLAQVLEYGEPTGSGPDPRHLERFWAAFLEKGLPSGDRVERGEQDGPLERVRTPTGEVPKREGRDGREDEGQERRKRARSQGPAEGEADAPARKTRRGKAPKAQEKAPTKKNPAAKKRRT